METATPPEAMAALPDDALASVLGRLPARSLAASRCVCGAWRDLVDERRLLLPHLLPHSVRGIFVNYDPEHGRPHFFARPAAATAGGPPINGEFDFIDDTEIDETDDFYDAAITDVTDHCNGLLLDAVRVQPHDARRAYLVFDPAVSPRYEVLLRPSELGKPVRVGGALMEWPSSTWTWQVFSSRTQQWEKKAFVREGEPAATGGGLQFHWYDFETGRHNSAYWQEALHMHFCCQYITRLSLSNNKYQVSKTPIVDAEYKEGIFFYLGRSENGLYFATVGRLCEFRVWTLREWRDGAEWDLIHHNFLKPSTWLWRTRRNYHRESYHGPWFFDAYYDEEEARELLEEQNIEWNSDDDDIMGVEEEVVEVTENIQFLGFHPYKEVVFLWDNYKVMALIRSDGRSPKATLTAMLSQLPTGNFAVSQCIYGMGCDLIDKSHGGRRR
ncbi:hypothetical protein ACP70R_008581 [Stipagrostis hirtigluma subsp. patula]